VSDTDPDRTARHWWWRCLACAEASLTTQMRGYGLAEPAYEQAVHAFSGGVLHQGHACGLLTGAVVAAGFAARERFAEAPRRCAAALHAAIGLASAYQDLAGSLECRAITGVSLREPAGALRYLAARKDRLCGRLHAEWQARARAVTDEALAEFEASAAPGSCANCAVRTVRALAPALGLPEDAAPLVAGLAGGVGLRGGVCGALTAGIFAWFAGQRLARAPRRRDSRTRRLLAGLAGTGERAAAAPLHQALVERFGSDRCATIAGRSFRDPDDHHRFIAAGGCAEVVRFVAAWVVNRSFPAPGDRPDQEMRCGSSPRQEED